MKFGKKISSQGKWKFEELSDEEVESALDTLREANLKEISKCKTKVDSAHLPSLLNKQLMSQFTYLSYVLEQKAQGKKIYTSTPKPILDMEKIEQKVDEQMKPPEDLKGEDLIGKALSEAQ